MTKAVPIPSAKSSGGVRQSPFKYTINVPEIYGRDGLKFTCVPSTTPDGTSRFSISPPFTAAMFHALLQDSTTQVLHFYIFQEPLSGGGSSCTNRRSRSSISASSNVSKFLFGVKKYVPIISKKPCISVTTFGCFFQRIIAAFSSTEGSSESV